MLFQDVKPGAAAPSAVSKAGEQGERASGSSHTCQICLLWHTLAQAGSHQLSRAGMCPWSRGRVPTDVVGLGG